MRRPYSGLKPARLLRCARNDTEDGDRLLCFGLGGGIFERRYSIISTKGGGITMGMQPLQDWVLIEPSEAKEKTAGGVIIPDTAKEKPVEGKVLAVGKGRWEIPEKKWGSKPKGKEEKVFKPTVLKPGDQVLYEKYGTTPVDLDGKELVLVRESDVLGWNNKR